MATERPATPQERLVNYAIGGILVLVAAYVLWRVFRRRRR